MEQVKQKINTFFTGLGKKIVCFFKSIPSKLKSRFAGGKEIITQGNIKVGASMCIMGLGQLLYKQWT